MNLLEELHISKNSKLALISNDQEMRYTEVIQKVGHYQILFDELRPRCIALYLDNCIEWVLIDLAAHMCDIPIVPLPTFFSQQQLIHLIEDVDADFLITTKQFNKQAIFSLFDDVTIKHESDHIEIYQRSISGKTKYPAGLSKITYTSGSTGSPKGVCLNAQAQLDISNSLQTVLQPLEIKKHLCVLPLSTLLENIAGVWAPLSIGASIAIPSLTELGFEGASQLDPKTFLDALVKYKPESIILVPELLNVLVHGCEAGMQMPNSLKFIAVGGAKVSVALLKRAQALNLPIYEGYGLSECCSVVTLNRPGQNIVGTSGQALPHINLRISSDNEIEVSGSNMLGYLHQNKPVSEFYATGDIGAIDEHGHVTVHGRKKNMFITSYGRQVNPEWVEETLLEQKQFLQAIVFGESLPFNVAVIVPRDENLDYESIDSLIEQCNQVLPNYAKVSHYVISYSPFNFKDKTLTLNGRLRRDAIWKLYEDQIRSLIESNDKINSTAAML